MYHRILASAVGVAFAMACFLAGPAAGQTAPNAKTSWSKRTSDGHPDLEGTWLNASLTPFERPKEMGTKQFLTKEEAAQIEKQAAENNVDRPPRPGDVGAYNQAWMDAGTKVASTLQTSLVTDPPDGRVPVLPEAETMRAYRLAHTDESWEYMSPWDRCVTRGMPSAMFPAGYNNAYHIFQVPGYVVIESEMIHEARVIPVDGRPHLPSNVLQWNGNSVGHWEGDTLVIDTTNFNGEGWISTSAAGGRIRGIGETPSLHLVEHLRRVDANTILWDVRIDDPKVFSKPWTVSIPWRRDDHYPIYEYACHEGNYAVPNILKAGRAKDRANGEGK